VLGCPAQLHGGGPMRIRLGFVVAVVPILLLVEAAAAGGKKGGGGSADGGGFVIQSCTGNPGPCLMPDGCPAIKNCVGGFWECGETYAASATRSASGRRDWLCRTRGSERTMGSSTGSPSRRHSRAVVYLSATEEGGAR
jgi:hypothetical protein